MDATNAKELPSISQAKWDIPGVVAQAEEALAASTTKPRIFQRGNVLVLIAPAEPKPKAAIKRTPGMPTIKECGPVVLRLALARAAAWFVFDARTKQDIGTMPLPWVVDTLHQSGEWPNILPLTGIITAPTFRANGTILDTPGYDAGTGLYYDPGETVFPKIPEHPTREDALAALRVLEAPFVDFPFKAPHDKSAVFAAILTLLIRHAIDGHVPLFGVSAPDAGTGKGLLVDTITAIATGRYAANFGMPPTEEEWKKQLFASALAGDQLVLIDNCNTTIASSELCRYLTATAVEGRILGLSKNGSAPQNAVYFATGNNLRFRSDIVRRVIPIRMQSEEEHPENRTEFVIEENLIKHALAKRGMLVCAALTILRAYHLASDKPTIARVGSFEEWAPMICGPLVWLGLANPQEGVEEIKAQDDDREKLRALLLAWHAVYGETPTLLGSAVDDIARHTIDPTSGTRYVPDEPHPPKRAIGDDNKTWDGEVTAYLNRVDMLKVYREHKDLADALKSYDRSRGPGLSSVSIGANLVAVQDRLVCGYILTKSPARTRGGYTWTVFRKSVCRCVACVGLSSCTREKANRDNLEMDIVGIESKNLHNLHQESGKLAKAPITQHVSACVGLPITYTQPTREPGDECDNDGNLRPI